MNFDNQYKHYINIIEGITNYTPFSKLSMDDKVKRLLSPQYKKGRYYHATDPDNMDKILKDGIKLNKDGEVWVSKDNPHYDDGMLFELDLEGFKLYPDKRWSDKHKTFISTTEIPSDRITRVYEYFKADDIREDILADQFKGIESDKIHILKDYLDKYNI